jgi:predicted metal-dependent peptidase
MDDEALQKVQKARAGLVLDQPFFASIALRMELVEDTAALDPVFEKPTMWVNGVSIGYHPDFIKSLTLDELKGVFCHEVMHVVLLHNLRRNDRDKVIWNVAGDYAINPLIENAGLTLPKGRLRETQYDNLEAEAIYSKIYRPTPKGKKGQKPGPGQGSSDPGQTGEVRDYPGKDGKGNPTLAEIAEQEQAQKIATQQALTAAKQAGNLPGNLERLIDELLEPVIPWKEVLARFVDSHAANDYTWTLPNKRYLTSGLYLPALRNPELGLILWGIDTSGSINQHQINEAIGEGKGAIRAYTNTKLLVIFADDALQGEPVEIGSESDLELIKPKGGGGTSFRPPFEYVCQQGIDPKAAIYFTDGYCSDFPEVPEYDVLWILTVKNKNFRPPFGEVIYMER